MSKKVMKKGAAMSRRNRDCDEENTNPCGDEQRQRRMSKRSRGISDFEGEYSEGLDLCSKILNYTYLSEAATEWKNIVTEGEDNGNPLLKRYSSVGKTMSDLVEKINPAINAKELCVLAAQITGSFGRDFIIKYYKILKAQNEEANKNDMNDLADMFINMFGNDTTDFKVDDMQSDSKIMAKIEGLKDQVKIELKKNLELMIDLQTKKQIREKEKFAKQIRKQEAEKAKKALIQKMHLIENVNYFIEQINANGEVLIKEYFIDQYNFHRTGDYTKANDTIKLVGEDDTTKQISNVDNIDGINLEAFSRAHTDYLHLIKDKESGILGLVMGKLGFSKDSCPPNPSSANPFEPIRPGRYCSNPCEELPSQTYDGGKSNKKPKSKKEAETSTLPKYVKTDRKCVCADKKQRTVYKRILKNGKESKADYVYLRKTKEYVPKW